MLISLDHALYSINYGMIKPYASVYNLLIVECCVYQISQIWFTVTVAIQ